MKKSKKAEAKSKALVPAAGLARRSTAQYLRDTSSGILASRLVTLRESRDDIRQSWRRVAALAADIIQNSGTLKGAVDQVLADTVGTELKLQCRPDLAQAGWSEVEIDRFVDVVERRWRRYAWTPGECDFRGKFTLPQQVDVGLRWQIAFGEVTGLIDYFSTPLRQRYGVETGTKLLLIPPYRLKQDTSEAEGLFQGVFHDENGRPVRYRFQRRQNGIETDAEFPAFDGDGRRRVMHVFDPVDATDVRGISVLAAAMRKYVQAETLDDATLQTAILQTVFAATLTSAQPSKDAFEALDLLEDESLKDEFAGYFTKALDRVRQGSVTIGGTSQINHLAPEESLKFHTAETPGAQYLPFSTALKRELARCLGVTYSSLAMDHGSMTYSSARMETASIWPVVLRRRERIAATMCQAVYEAWLDEEIGEGRIAYKGGYTAFRRQKPLATWTEWRGPARPVADDEKAARASTERLYNCTTTLADECAELGRDSRDVINQRSREQAMLAAAGLPSPFRRTTGGGATADSGATPDSGSSQGATP